MCDGLAALHCDLISLLSCTYSLNKPTAYFKDLLSLYLFGLFAFGVLSLGLFGVDGRSLCRRALKYIM